MVNAPTLLPVHSRCTIFRHRDDDDLLAYFQSTALHARPPPLSADVQKLWRTFAIQGMKLYVRWHYAAMTNVQGLPTMVVRYEDLMKSPVSVFSRLLQFVDGSVQIDDVHRALEKFPPHNNYTLVQAVPYYVRAAPHFMTHEIVESMLSTLNRTLVDVLADRNTDRRVNVHAEWIQFVRQLDLSRWSVVGSVSGGSDSSRFVGALT